MINLYFTQVDSPCGTVMYQIISVVISYALSNLKLFMKWEKFVFKFKWSTVILSHIISIL